VKVSLSRFRLVSLYVFEHAVVALIVFLQHSSDLFCPLPYSKMLSTANAGKTRAVPTTVFYDSEIGIWSSPNVPSLVRPIPPYKTGPPSNLRYDGLTDFHISNPYLAFWPLNPSWTAPIVGRLNFNAQSLEKT
jgi:hypothetical protein